MKPLFILAALATFVRVDSNTGIVENSESPNGLYHIESTFASDGTYFAVATKDETDVSPPFESDFVVLRSIALQCKLTKVYWRRDSACFVLDTGHDRHHGDFLIARKVGTTFQLLPFDAGTIYASSKLHAAFLYPRFKAWLAPNRVEIEINGFDGLNTYRPVNFVLDLANNLKVVSSQILPGAKDPK